jgi:hypothetical protein
MSWSFDISSRPLPAGHVTGDYVTMVAVAQAIADCGGADALIMSDYMAASYDASAPEQWYSPYNKLMLEALAAGKLLQQAAALWAGLFWHCFELFLGCSWTVLGRFWGGFGAVLGVFLDHWVSTLVLCFESQP